MVRKSTVISTLAILGYVVMGLLNSQAVSLAAPADEDNGNIDVLTPDEKQPTPEEIEAQKKKADAREERMKRIRAQRAEQKKAAAEKAAAEAAAASVKIRARATKMQPNDVPVNIAWRWGGEGLGGGRYSGKFGDNIPLGQWTEPIALSSIARGARRVFFLTVTVGQVPLSREDKAAGKTNSAITNLEMEFEFSYNGKVLKTVTGAGPSAANIGLAIPAGIFEGGEAAFKNLEAVADLGSLLDYAKGRATMLEALPWAGKALPSKMSLLTDLGGYAAEGTGYGKRYSDPAIVDAELRSLRQLGVNGLRAMPDFVLEKMQAGEGYEKFSRALLVNSMGFPVPRYRKGRAEDPEAGCPYEDGVPERTRAGIASALERMLALPSEEVWGLTDDEIGSVFDGAPEGKAHMALHDKDIRAYQQFLQAKGLQPQQFGATDWSQVKPVNLWNRDKNAPKPNYDDPHVGLNAYYTRLFNNYSTAKLFTPLREAFDKENAKKRAALAAGKLDSAEAKQPWIYSFALRGNSFLMGGHSLDFFNFYRHADNAFLYETSNRDPRIWGWDSYLCDVGRVVTAEQKQEFGIYIKPHRGAPVQRAMSAVSRGSELIYWYTYGPDYFKGDSFSSRESSLQETSKAAHLIGASEDAVAGAQWLHPAEVAIIKPFSLMAWKGGPEGTAAWEDTKWTYSALQHAHIPVDPIDEGILENSDLARYKVIYLPSPNLRRESAQKLDAWVKAGGTLVTHANGLSRDEANQPMDILTSALGLTKRSAPEMWFNVRTYGSTSLQGYPEEKSILAPIPEDAVVTATKFYDKTPLKLTIGREVLYPDEGTEVLARYADNSVAATRHSYGEGTVYTTGFYAGLEYSIPIRGSVFDMDKDLSEATRNFISAPVTQAGVRPAVWTSAPTTEGVLLKHPKSGARSVTLANWAYRVYQEGEDTRKRELVKQKNLAISIRDAGPVKSIRSAWLDKELEFEVVGDVVKVVLPELEEGDVLLLK